MSRFAADPRWLDLPAAHDVARRDQPRRRACWSTPPRRSPTTATAGVPTRGLRGEAHGLARRRGRLPRRGRRRTPVRRRRPARPASSTPAPAGGSSTTDDLERRFLDRVRDAVDDRRPLGASSTPTGSLPRLRADAVVGQGAGACSAASTRRSAPPARPALRRAARGARARRPNAASTSDGAARAARRRAREHARRGTSTPTAATAGRSTSLDDLKLAPFHLLATEGARPHRPDHVWHMETLAALADADPDLLAPTPSDGSSTSTDPASRGRRRRLVGGADRPRAARGWSSSRCDFIATRPRRARRSRP